MPDIFVAQPKLSRPEVTEYSTVMAEEKRTKNPLAAFMVRPKKMRFETQERKEMILLVLRRHVVTNVGWILLVVFGVLLPGILVLFPFWAGLPGNLKFVGTIVWYLLVFGYALEGFMTWYFNVFIVTDERIIDIDFYSLLYKRVSSAKIDDCNSPVSSVFMR